MATQNKSANCVYIDDSRKRRLGQHFGTRGRSLRMELLEDRRLLAVMPNDPLFSRQWALENTGQESGTPGADISITSAWEEFGTGSTNVVVGILGVGVDYKHPDLYKNIWLNQNEIPPAIRSTLQDVDADNRITFWDLNDLANWDSINPPNSFVTDLNGNGYIDAGDLLDTTEVSTPWEDGIDNEGDGYTDDLIGWDFEHDDNDPQSIDSGFINSKGHETRIAGIIAAEGDNNIGIAGVVWQSQLMVLKLPPDVVDPGNIENPTPKLLDGLDYLAVQHDHDVPIRVSNYSFSGSINPEYYRSRFQAFEQREMLLVNSAGNLRGDLDLPFLYLDPSDFPDIPNFPADTYIDTFSGTLPPPIGLLDISSSIVVGGTDRDDDIWTRTSTAGSNFGANSVQLGAPADDIISTWPLDVINPDGPDPYNSQNGTSFAGPMVAGTIALAWSAFPHASMQEVRDAIMLGVDVKPEFDNLWVTEGRLNVQTTLDILSVTVPPRVTGVSISSSIPLSNDGT